MRTLLYNPIFINPQAYYVFPRLSKYLQSDNESTAEPANYIGTIEVKVIAYGDTNLKRTYTHTSEIDLTEFRNSWIRISLFTQAGSCVLGEWKIGALNPEYIDPEVLASLKAVVIVDNKTNQDSDRAVVKNLVDRSNPFIISNAAYTEGSGYANGAFVTDGVDDMITSTKTIEQMGITINDGCTVISMIHQIDGVGIGQEIPVNVISYKPGDYFNANFNFPSIVGTTGIFGYTNQNGTNDLVTNILGDNKTHRVSGTATAHDGHFNIYRIQKPSKLAWYWTVIANKVLTTDQINQVIAYYNLDKYVTPDILYDVKRQGITNDNHTEFGDKLIDYSGNGRDLQLYNIAWKENSGYKDGAICFDGVDDYGKVTGIPVLKDYTVVVDYQRLAKAFVSGYGDGCIVSKYGDKEHGAFLMNNGVYYADGDMYPMSFGSSTVIKLNDFNRRIYYQSKYSNQGIRITSGNFTDIDTLWLGTFRDDDPRFFNGVVYSLMTFPYSLSEFLIERQLKKHNLGTLHPEEPINNN